MFTDDHFAGFNFLNAPKVKTEEKEKYLFWHSLNLGDFFCSGEWEGESEDEQEAQRPLLLHHLHQGRALVLLHQGRALERPWKRRSSRPTPLPCYTKIFFYSPFQHNFKLKYNSKLYTFFLLSVFYFNIIGNNLLKSIERGYHVGFDWFDKNRGIHLESKQLSRMALVSRHQVESNKAAFGIKMH